MGVKIIFISGISGGGKTTFANYLEKHFKANGIECITLSQDSYYKDNSEKLKNDYNNNLDNFNTNHNFDEPNAIESKKLEQDIEAIRIGQSIPRRKYVMKTKKVSYDKQEMLGFDFTNNKQKILIVEGHMIPLFKNIIGKYEDSEKMFIDLPIEVAHERRFVRNEADLSESIDNKIWEKKWKEEVIPCYKNVSEEAFKKSNHKWINVNNHGKREDLDILAKHLANSILGIRFIHKVKQVPNNMTRVNANSNSAQSQLARRINNSCCIMM